MSRPHLPDHPKVSINDCSREEEEEEEEASALQNAEFNSNQKFLAPLDEDSPHRSSCGRSHRFPESQAAAAPAAASAVPAPLPVDGTSARTKTFLGFIDVAADDEAARTAAVESLGSASAENNSLYRNPLTIGVAVAVLFLIALATFFAVVFSRNFPFQSECRECVDGGFVYNESSAQCLRNISTREGFRFYKPVQGNLTTAHVVLDRGYCGRASCTFKSILPRVRLVPLWFILLTTLASVVFSVLFQVFKLFVVRPLRRKCHATFVTGASDADLLDDYDLLRSESERRVWVLIQCAGAMSPFWFLFLYLFALAHLTYLLVVFHRDRKQDNGENASTWQTFVAAYSAFINSGSTAVLMISFSQVAGALAIEHYVRAMAENPQEQQKQQQQQQQQQQSDAGDSGGVSVIRSMSPAQSLLSREEAVFIPRSQRQKENKKKKKKTPQRILREALSSIVFPWRSVALSVYILAPLVPIAALLVPGIFIWAPVSIGLMMSWRLLIWIAQQPRFASISTIIAARVFGSFLVMIFFQLLSNYFTLFQSDEGHDWFFAMRQEWNSRDFPCYVNAIQNDMAAVWNFWGLLLS